METLQLQNEPIYTFNPHNAQLKNIGQITGEYTVIQKDIMINGFGLTLVSDSINIYLVINK